MVNIELSREMRQKKTAGFYRVFGVLTLQHGVKSTAIGLMHAARIHNYLTFILFIEFVAHVEYWHSFCMEH